MKRIIPDYLEHRLPANKKLIEYIDEGTRSYLLALCTSIYPDSADKAYVLTGVDPGGTMQTASYSQGYIFYNKQIFFVPAFSFTRPQPGAERSRGLVIETTVTNEEYRSGQTFPAYEEKKLILSPNDVFDPPLDLDSLIRNFLVFDFLKFDIPVTSSYFEKKEAQTITNGNTQRLLMHLKMLSAMANANTHARFTTYFAKKGLIGIGKIVNKTTQKTFDVWVYQVGNFTLIKRPWDAEPATATDTINWSTLWEYVNPATNGGIIVEGEAGQQGADFTTVAADITLYINITHERV